jgi:hypothetical protein
LWDTVVQWTVLLLPTTVQLLLPWTLTLVVLVLWLLWLDEANAVVEVRAMVPVAVQAINPRTSGDERRRIVGIPS